MAVGEAAFCHFKDLVRHRAGFIEDVETGGVGGVSAGKRLRVLFLAGGGRAEPGLFAIAVIQPVRRADKPGRGQTEPVPLLDGRPGLGFQLNVGVGGDRAARIGPGRHQPEDDPGYQGALADTMARCHCATNWRNRITPVRGALPNLLTNFSQLLTLPFVGSRKVLKWVAGFAPRKKHLDKTQRIRIKLPRQVEQLERAGGLFPRGD